MYHRIWERSQTWAQVVGHGGLAIVLIKPAFQKVKRFGATLTRTKYDCQRTWFYCGTRILHVIHGRDNRATF